MNRLTVGSILVLALLLAGVADAADSPQFRGPNRDGKFPEKGLLKAWPAGGPPLAWTATGIGMGYASPSVVDDTIYVPGMADDGNGYLYALGTDGKIRWQMKYGQETGDRQAPGSRSTPTIDGNRAYLLSGMGVLVCINLEARAVDWSVNILDRFEGKNPQWSVAEAILVDGNNVICTPGGAKGSVAALNKTTGATVWVTSGLTDEPSYCSADIINHNGRRILLTETAKFVVGIDPDSGKLLWKHPHPTKYDIHAVTPVYADGLVYYSGGYGSGGGVLRLSEDGSKATPLWQDKNLDCQHHGVILHEGYLYGTAHQAGREMLCLELATGKVMWRTGEVTQSVLVYAEGMLYAYEGPKKGVVHLIEATPKGFNRTGQFSITEGSANHWAHPTIANGRLYIRRGDYLFAYDVK